MEKLQAVGEGKKLD